MRVLIFTALAAMVLAMAPPAGAAEDEEASAAGEADVELDSSSWSFTGGPIWQKRNGWGIMAGIGGVGCVRQYCNSKMDTNYFGSFAGFLGAYYRWIPNLSFFADVNLAHVNTNMTTPDGSQPGEDKGLLFELALGAKFHIPISGWLDVNLGFGFGLSALSFKADNYMDAPHKSSFVGLDLQGRLGADLYLFSAAPTLALGPTLRFAFPYWGRTCFNGLVGTDTNNTLVDTCGKPDEVQKAITNENVGNWHINETPLLLIFGIEAKYGF